MAVRAELRGIDLEHVHEIAQDGDGATLAKPDVVRVAVLGVGVALETDAHPPIGVDDARVRDQRVDRHRVEACSIGVEVHGAHAVGAGVHCG